LRSVVISKLLAAYVSNICLIVNLRRRHYTYRRDAGALTNGNQLSQDRPNDFHCKVNDECCVTGNCNNDDRTELITIKIAITGGTSKVKVCD